jgi:hypothetical protein
VKYFLLATLILVLAMGSFAQTASNDPFPPIPGQRRQDEDSHILKGMLAKQQTSREKKEYAELLERANDAVKLSNELAGSLEKNKVFSETERKQLAEFEKILAKIRDDLGGDDDGETNITTEKDAKPPRDVREGVLYLKRSTENLLDQLKRSTRFSISVAAIETSNTLIRLARFLRLKN